jgi:hypothetical protein
VKISGFKSGGRVGVDFSSGDACLAALALGFQLMNEKAGWLWLFSKNSAIGVPSSSLGGGSWVGSGRMNAEER